VVTTPQHQYARICVGGLTGTLDSMQNVATVFIRGNKLTGACYKLYIGSDNVRVIYSDGTTDTTLSNDTNTGSLPTDVYEIEADGTTITYYFNYMHVRDITHTALTNGVSGIGIRTSTGNARIDDFYASHEPPSSPLPIFYSF
jgi:hypothetical protein